VHPDSFPTDITKPNENKQGQTSSEQPANTEHSESPTCSGRGGRRVKSCHSDQLHTQAAELTQLSDKDSELRTPGVRRKLCCHLSVQGALSIARSPDVGCFSSLFKPKVDWF